MTGTFSSLGVALSGLRYNQAVLDNASNNIANASTDGYVRRSVVGGSVIVGQPAMYARYDGHGDGVAVQAVTRQVDPLLDAQVRSAHGSMNYLTTQQTVLSTVENGIGEPSDTGVAAALAQFNNAWQDLANNPGTDATRQQVIGQGQTLARAINGQVGNIVNQEADQRLHLLANVSDINTAATALAQLNTTIQSGSQSGLDVNSLKDQRDQLALQIANLAGGSVSVQSNGMYDVSVGGVALVTGQSSGTLVINTGVTPTGAADGNPITFRVDTAAGSTALPGNLGGEAGGVTDLLTNALPNYKAGLDQVAQQLADAVNTQHQAGFDAAGNPGVPFFSYNPANPGATLAVALASSSQVAASGIPGGNLDGSNADTLSTSAKAAGDSYQRLVNGFGTQVAAVNQQSSNQATLTTSLDNSREQQAGVNLDEETVSMVTSQRAYQAAARVMTTLDDVLDTLINHCGLIGG